MTQPIKKRPPRKIKDITKMSDVIVYRLRRYATEIKKGKYGGCEKCQKEIPAARLKVSPEARFCLDCKQ